MQLFSKTKTLFFSFLLLTVCVGKIQAQNEQVYLINASKLSSFQQRSTSDPAFKADVDAMLKTADKSLKAKLISVVEKGFPTPCGNKHEYMSMASYFWPDPSKPDGLPYIRKDGERNPENSKVTDHKGFDDLISHVTALSWAYYFSRDEKYAAKAVKLLKFWCLDTATYMLPNLNHAQIIRGVDTGRGIGIIDIHLVPQLLDGINLIKHSASMTPKDFEAVRSWFEQLLFWLRDSDHGKKEAVSKNNHQTYYESLTASLALFTGHEKMAKEIFIGSKKLLESQLETDGKQPLELARTNAKSYSTFNLRAWFMLAALAENQGIDLWHYQSADGKSIQKALDFMIPYVNGEKNWTYQQIGSYEADDFALLLYRAAEKFNQPKYREIAIKMNPSVGTIGKLLYTN